MIFFHSITTLESNKQNMYTRTYTGTDFTLSDTTVKRSTVSRDITLLVFSLYRPISVEDTDVS